MRSPALASAPAAPIQGAAPTAAEQLRQRLLATLARLDAQQVAAQARAARYPELSAPEYDEPRRPLRFGGLSHMQGCPLD